MLVLSFVSESCVLVFCLNRLQGMVAFGAKDVVRILTTSHVNIYIKKMCWTDDSDDVHF